MALLVLGDLGIAIGGQVSDDDRNLMQPGADRCTQPLGAEVNFVPAIAVGRMHDERLQDAALLDVRGKLIEPVLVLAVVTQRANVAVRLRFLMDLLGESVPVARLR